MLLLAVLQAAMVLPPGVQLRETGAGRFLTDARGMSLYTYAQDQPGKSVCNGECAKNWPPLAAPADAVPQGDWTVIQRDDGGRQWAWRGSALYNFAKDSYPGGLLGDGAGNAWRAAYDRIALPPALRLRSIYLGRVLTDMRGFTLYWQLKDQGCQDKCLATWLPLTAPWLAKPQGDWSAQPLKDGQRQWAYRGRRLYLHVDDLKPADTSGHEIAKEWQAAVLDAAAPLPDWVTVQNSDMGAIFADARGHTLYTFSGDLERTKKLMCDDACMRRFWQTIPAAANSQARGDWTAIASPNAKGLLVWAYRGNILYTHTRDKEPGAIGGDKFTAGVGGFGGSWFPIVRRRDFEE
jgi:predicted lipoprotein with Yx(FWY)xxD motif